MNERLLQYWEKASQYWKQVTKKQKIIFFSALFFIIVTLGLIVYNFSKTEYQIAFTNLDAADAGKVTEYLKSNGIDYKITDDGKGIGVPSTVASQVKIDVESQGLVRNGSIGYGIFKDNLSSFGMTDNEFNILSVDALSGEIQQLISNISGVSDSKVVINMPKESVFVNTDEQDKATASVTVQFKPGYAADQRKIDTIYNLVSHSVPNLPVENITVADENGELSLSSSAAGIVDAAGAVSQQFQIKKQFESDIQKKIQAMLGQMLGQNRVIVSVFSTLNFDKKKIDEQRYEPVNKDTGKGIERSVQESEESSTTDGGSTGGIAGTGDSEVPNYPGSSSSGTSKSEKTQSTINYEVDQINKQIISSPFMVKDLSISVGIEPSGSSNALSKQTRDDVERMLKIIVNSSLADSDQGPLTDVQLSNKVMVFAHKFQSNTVTGTRNMFSNATWFAIGAAVLALVAGGGMLIYRRRKAAARAAMEEDMAMTTNTELPTLDLDQISNDNQVRKQLEMLAKRKPDEFVNLLRTWLVDE